MLLSLLSPSVTHSPNMMNKAEGNRYRDLFIAIALAYFQTNLTCAEVRQFPNLSVKVDQ
jgi:hypothetical protein